MTRRGTHAKRGAARRSMAADTILWYLDREGSVAYRLVRGAGLDQLVRDGKAAIVKLVGVRAQQVVRVQAGAKT